jgi:flavin-dependent dehydrogenase
VATDVVIAGAGPAGISCAVALVRREPSLRGRVLVLDRARFPRDKPAAASPVTPPRRWRRSASS